MKIQSFKIEKAGHTFIIEHSKNGHGSTLVTIHSDCLMKYGDWEFDEKDEKVKKINARFKGEYLEIINGYILIDSKKYGKFTISNEISASLKKRIADDIEDREKEKQEREADRPIQAINYENIITFSYGCDTGILYSKHNKEAIELALKNGASKGSIFRGERNDKCKFAGTMDNDILDTDLLAENVERGLNPKWDENGRLILNTHEFYKHIFCEDRHYIAKSEYEIALEIIQKEADKIKEKNANELNAKFQLAKEKNEPVIILKTVAHESDTPLKNDGEDDIVDIVTYAMPDGKTITKYFHNY